MTLNFPLGINKSISPSPCSPVSGPGTWWSPLRPQLGRWYGRALDPANQETNTAVLKRRQKQIQYGKNTSGYQNYLQQIPK